MSTKRVISALFSLAMAIGWYLFWPMLTRFRNEFGLNAMVVPWFIYSLIPFLFVTIFLTIGKMSQDSLAGFFTALKTIGIKRFIIMAIFCLVAFPPILYLFGMVIFNGR